MCSQCMDFLAKLFWFNMSEKELIQTKGEQPVAKISTEELDFLIGREFPDHKEVVKDKFKRIRSESKGGMQRIAAAILKLADKDFNKLDLLVNRANEDFRDVISKAEYPRVSDNGFGELEDQVLKRYYLEDWEDYVKWREGKR